MKKKNIKSAFTLVELMIAVAIIGILAAVAMTSFQRYVLKSKLSEAYVMLQKLHNGAIIEASSPNISVKDSFSGRTGIGPKDVAFGFLHSLTVPRGKKEKVAFTLFSESEMPFSSNGIPTCPFANGKQVSSNFGVAFEQEYFVGDILYSVETYHFAPMVTLEVRGVLSNALIAEGLPAVNVKFVKSQDPSVTCPVYQTMMVSAVGDLDGDSDGYSDEYYVFYLYRDPKKMYLERYMYIDQNTGEIQSLPGIVTFNIGE